MSVLTSASAQGTVTLSKECAKFAFCIDSRTETVPYVERVLIQQTADLLGSTGL